jgi:hypothetical protein
MDDAPRLRIEAEDNMFVLVKVTVPVVKVRNVVALKVQGPETVLLKLPVRERPPVPDMLDGKVRLDTVAVTVKRALLENTIFLGMEIAAPTNSVLLPVTLIWVDAAPKFASWLIPSCAVVSVVPPE